MSRKSKIEIIIRWKSSETRFVFGNSAIWTYVLNKKKKIQRYHNENTKSTLNIFMSMENTWRNCLGRVAVRDIHTTYNKMLPLSLREFMRPFLLTFTLISMIHKHELLNLILLRITMRTFWHLPLVRRRTTADKLLRCSFQKYTTQTITLIIFCI